MITIRDLAKFSVLVALFGILSDATLAHALLWENDPYWTYWITKTVLIGVVFAIGTALMGMGKGRGAVIALIHAVILSIYYWSFSPIGLPDDPKWLDLSHAWITGIPIHFLVLYIGYLLALWVWRNAEAADGNVDSRMIVGRGLVMALMAVIVMGVISSLLLGQFVGVTWFITRLLIIFAFILVWAAFTPRGAPYLFGGAFILSLVLTAYSHYLGPLGIPGTWRVFQNIDPITTPRWLNYRELWLVQFPIYYVLSLLAVYRPGVGAVKKAKVKSKS